MKVKTSELTRAALNWVVASIEWPNDTGVLNPELVSKESVNEEYPFDRDWSLTGLLIEKAGVTLAYKYGRNTHFYNWAAWCPTKEMMYGDTALTAAAGAYVIDKLGDEVEVPDHLL